MSQPGRMRAALDHLARIEQAIAVGAFLLLAGVVFADVVVRELTGTGLHWAMQIGVYANLVVVVAGFGLASAGGGHLRPRFADRWLPAAWEPVLVRLQEACMAVFCLAFAVLGVLVMLETWQLDDRSAVLGTPLWLPQSLLPLMFGLGGLRHLAYAVWPGLRPAPQHTRAGTAG